MRLALSVLLVSLCTVVNAFAEPRLLSAYVPGADGVLLATDVWLPSDAPEISQRIPTIVQFTRYWRAFREAGASDHETIGYLTSAGYAVAVVDVRGTGASFGFRETEFSDAEVADFGAVFDWIVAQPWSNGRLATLGSSYLGNTAELAAMTGHSALRAVVPRFSDFSEYRHAIRPGGVRNAVIASAWAQFVAALDRNDPCAAFMNALGPDCAPGAPWIGGVAPVTDDDSLLARAIAAHAANADVGRIAGAIQFSDDTFDRDSRPSVTLHSVSPSGRWGQIDAAGVPAFHWASWFDGGTAEGVLTRFELYRRTPLRVVIGAWTHGGGRRADTMQLTEEPADPAPGAQLATIVSFLDPLLKAEEGASSSAVSNIRYFTLGANTWRTTTTWPPRGVSSRRWRLQEESGLAEGRSARGADTYNVDFSATTGVKNRWHTQLGEAVDYGDRSSADRRLLTYTSAPFERGVEITGAPIARIDLMASQSDGALFVYLEGVLPDGRVVYISEGVRRLWFSGGAGDAPGLQGFTRADARRVHPGRSLVMNFALNPISIELPAGSRIRIAIGGADADTFERLPANGAALSYSIRRSRSYVDIPMMEPQAH